MSKHGNFGLLLMCFTKVLCRKKKREIQIFIGKKKKESTDLNMYCSFSRQCFIKSFFIMQVHRDTLFLRRSRGQKQVWIMKNSFFDMKPLLFLRYPVSRRSQ